MMTGMASADDISDLLHQHPVIDGHNDLLWALRELVGYDLDRYDVGQRQSDTQTDLPRLREGGVGAQFWSVFVPTQEGPRAVTSTLEQIDAAYAMVERYGDRLALATTADEVEAAWSSGRIACLMGAEGGHQIDGSLAVLRLYHRLGVRYLTLTHNDNVAWADSATDEPVLGGLNDGGRGVVAEMNRIGMIVDLSHVSHDAMRDALEVARAPVMFSHSSAHAVCDHPRNVPDDVLERLVRERRHVSGDLRATVREPGGAGVGARGRAPRPRAGVDLRDIAATQLVERAYRDESPHPPSVLADVVAHLEHVRDVAGVDHVGLGGDYDGVDRLPVGLEDVASYPRLLGALDERHWSADDLAKLTCRNVLRTMRDVETVADGP